MLHCMHPTRSCCRSFLLPRLQVRRVSRQLGECLRSLQAMMQGRLPPER